jgi:DNA recombination protein RmuC
MKHLDPLQDKIHLFERKSKTHKESIDYHAALRQQILGLREMNIQMSKETHHPNESAKGCKDAKLGRTSLERVLEKIRLGKGREYEVQQKASQPRKCFQMWSSI